MIATHRLEAAPIAALSTAYDCAKRSAIAFQPQWHCVYTRPKGELAANESLRRSGFDTFLPRYEMVWRDRTRIVRPMFPRYTLVRFDVVHDVWSRFIDDEHGRQVGAVMISASFRPLTVPDAIVDALLAQTAADGVIYPPQPRQMRRGDLGRVAGGPLAEFQGICARTSKERVWLLLDILGRKSEVGFARADVAAA